MMEQEYAGGKSYDEGEEEAPEDKGTPPAMNMPPQVRRKIASRLMR
jgi:hypothetical protein